MVVRDYDVLIRRRSHWTRSPGPGDLPAHRCVNVLIRANGVRVTAALGAPVIAAIAFGLTPYVHPAGAQISILGMTTRTEEGASGSGCIIPWVEKMSQPAAQAPNTSDSDKTPEAASWRAEAPKKRRDCDKPICSEFRGTRSPFTVPVRLG